jgi:hypothetical protein
MAERTTITQVLQLGVETTPGTSVAANKFLPSVMINTGIDGNFTEQRGSGNKFPINWIPGKEWARGSLSGYPTYDELTYLMSSVMSYATPATVDTSGRTWTHTIAGLAEDTVKTYTVEQGSALRAQKFTGGQITEITLTGTRESIDMSGSLIGKAFTDGITLTATPTAVPQIPILPKHVSIYMDDTSAGLGTTKMTRALSWEISVKNRFAPLWVVDAAQTSYVASIEQAVDASCKFKFEADTQGMGLLTTARAGSKKFIRVEAVSDQLAGAASAFYKMTWDICGQVKTFPNEISDQDGVYAVEWEMGMVYDATWTKATTLAIINKTTAL